MGTLEEQVKELLKRIEKLEQDNKELDKRLKPLEQDKFYEDEAAIERSWRGE